MPPKTFIGAIVAVVVVVAVILAGFRVGPFGSKSSERRDPKPRVVERRDLRVLVAIDTSGSMAKPIPDESVRRIDAAIEGTKAGLGKLTLPYELGVWVFAQPGHTEVVPIGPASGRLESIGGQLATLARDQRTDGGTPLYTTIADGVGALRLAALADAKETISALVILTDGRDAPPRAMVRAGTAKSADQLNAVLADAGNVQVLVTAALKRCSTLFAAVRSLPAENCLTVNTSDDIERRLGAVLTRLENARTRRAGP
jgi:hypothetical protein